MPCFERMAKDCIGPVLHYILCQKSGSRLKTLVQHLILYAFDFACVLNPSDARRGTKLRETLAGVSCTAMKYSRIPRSCGSGSAIRTKQDPGGCDPLEEHPTTKTLVIRVRNQDQG